jgi:predicted enzyme related to lactoylglutathione lyase
LKTPDEA